MNGLKIHATATVADLSQADAVIIGSGTKILDATQNDALMSQIQLDGERQLIAAQCSGALILEKLKLLNDLPVCTDLDTKPWVEALGVRVLNQPFFASKNIAQSIKFSTRVAGRVCGHCDAGVVGAELKCDADARLLWRVVRVDFWLP
jgi:hypothetical protein